MIALSDEILIAVLTALTGAASAYGSIRARLSTLERHTKDYHALLERVHDTVLTLPCKGKPICPEAPHDPPSGP